MQNAQNTEIQQRVINLVELYRTKVGCESDIAKKAKYDYEHEELESGVDEQGRPYTIGGGYDYDEMLVKHLMVNEQLLGHFYTEVAGSKAEKDVLDSLLPDVYDKTIFTEEEESFLKSHFKEMVNYIILTPCDEGLKWVHRSDNKDILTIPTEVLELISSRVDIPTGAKIFNPIPGFAQFTNLFKDCKFLCNGENAWMKVFIYANDTNVEIIEGEGIPASYDAIVSYLPIDSSEFVEHICKAYENLQTDGTFILLCPCKLLVDEAYSSFRRMLVDDKAIKEIVQLPHVMSQNASNPYCLLIANKGRKENEITFIDARTACNVVNIDDCVLKSFDIAQFDAILKNNGRDSDNGLRKVVRIPKEELVQDILMPQVYVIEKPTKAEFPVPLSTLCTIESTTVGDAQVDLPEGTPWLNMADYLNLFTEVRIENERDFDGDKFLEVVKKGIINMPKSLMDRLSQLIPSKEFRDYQYKVSTYLDGNSDVVLYKDVPNSGIHVALVKAPGKPFAVSNIILVFRPKGNFDAKSLAAILRLPIVYRQISAYRDYGVERFFDNILVPTDKRIVSDEILRMVKEESIAKKIKENAVAMKADYVNEVRLRKHDMRPHMRQLNSAKNLMQYYVDNMDMADDMREKLNRQISSFQDALHHLSDIIEHLNDEEKFGEPEIIRLDEYFKNLVAESANGSYKIEYTKDKERIHHYLNDKVYQFIDHVQSSVKPKDEEYKKGKWDMGTTWGYANIAPLDFDRLVQNIIENACRHGFTDSSRADYKITINLGVDEKRNMYQIDFSNNGTPMPEGMTKARYGIKGEKAGLRSGTGCGGYIVKSIADHFGGDYDVLCENGKTTIRIYLPIATI